MWFSRFRRRALGLLPVVVLAIFTGISQGLLGTCGPFTDVAADTFCPFVLEIYYLGITTGTSPTTYDPTGNVNRLQMAAFLSRTVDNTLRRGSRRAVLKRFWIPWSETALDVTTVGSNLRDPAFDGADVWVPSSVDGIVARVRASDGSLLGTWTGAVSAVGAVSAMGKVFVAGATTPGSLYRIDPRQPPGAVTVVASNLGNAPFSLAFDGVRIWTANGNAVGSVSIVTPGASIPWPATTFAIGLGSSSPNGILYDGANIWVSDQTAGTLLKLNSNGAVLQTVTVGLTPQFPIFDGANIWVPAEDSNSVSVVRSSSGAVLATLTGNGLSFPRAAAFDGERVLVTNPGGDSVSLWKAADLTAIGSYPTGASSVPIGACSDG